ncbi:putative disease resistance protein RGA4 [Mangifera indica]|uniref:putative disease resistance protein RGA4 n=1 Tax=Mangifera indica TaxID=29780 RepID=UPI001CFC250D|nr:putative disease resistance protein RGA4 [Mangifera indica]
MAEAVLFNIADEILGKIGKLALREMDMIWSVKKEIEKLNNTVSAIKAVVLDAEEQQAKSHEVRDWLGKLKLAIYDVDDLLDDFSTEVRRRRLILQQEKKTKEIRNFFSKLKHVAYSVKMGHKIKEIREKLDHIAADKIKYHFIDRPNENVMQAEKMEREQTHSFVRVEEVIGRDEDRNLIVGLLLDSNVTENVSVVPIVGIGGLGKTTLAQIVYNDERIRKHFEIRMWVCVSNVFNVKIIVQKILQSATHAKYDDLEMERLQAHLRKEIDGRKYLLVLDDVWNEDRERWLKLKDLLMSGLPGSKIIVTTRTQLVADITGTIAKSYDLQGLPSDESWCLFKKMAFKQGQEPDNSKLVAIGKEIVTKCAGVPLAIRSIGSLLYSKDSESEWLYFKNKELSKTSQDKNDMMSILQLSFDQLPSYLKQCFAYCSLFPKDHEISKQMLVNLWMAQGFIQSSNENQNLEETGDQYFMELLRRSFFQDADYDQWGNVISFKMHDLMHDLAQSVAGSESSMVHLDAKNISKRIRHVSFDAAVDSSWKIPNSLVEANRIRTFLLPLQPVSHRILKKVSHDEIISCFKYLHALDLHNTGVDHVPIGIGKLKHLRYLDLSKNKDIIRLPSSITRLQNLQTLKLSICKMLEKLPRYMRKMTSLRHLELDQCIGLSHMPSGLGQLTALLTLTRFVVGKASSSSSSSGSLRELKYLYNLRGELTIAKLENLKNVASESREANLKSKQHLQVLRLEWTREANNHKIIKEDEKLLEILQPHSELKEFHIYGYRGGRFPNWIISDLSLLLPNLLEIIIWRCYRCVELPLFSQLPMLKVLKLEEVTAVEYIETSNYISYSSSSSRCNPHMSETERSATFFPSLKELRLFDLRNSKGWWREAVDEASLPTFPCLLKLVIGHCPELGFLPLHPILEELELKDTSETLIKKLMVTAAETKEISTTATTISFSSSSSLLSKLKFLSIDSVTDLVSLPLEGLQSLTSLEHLSVSNCSKLLCLPGEALRGLTSLRFLSISGCAKLMSLSKGLKHLTTLEELEINECRELDLSNGDEDGMQLQGLKCLRTLKIIDMPKLVSISDGLQDATSLQNLWIRICPGLKTLPEWMGNLTLLRRLEISDCLGLTSLPQSMCYLKALQSLKISKCPQLFPVNQKETSANWPQIAHIPDIQIDRETSKCHKDQQPPRKCS